MEDLSSLLIEFGNFFQRCSLTSIANETLLVFLLECVQTFNIYIVYHMW